MTPQLQHLPLALLLGLPLLAGCVGSKERYEAGIELAARGRHAEAVRYYAAVLERAPTETARERLLEAGTQAAGELLEEARAAERRGGYDEALRVLERLDTLRAETERVGVALPLPNSYPAYRTSMLEAAIAARLRRAERAERTGDWAEAVQTYEAVQAAYDLPEARRTALDQARARALLRWSRQELGQKHYRDAYRLAQDAVNAGGGQTSEAAQVQADALAAGTRSVAFLPLWVPATVEQAMTPERLRDLQTALRERHWAHPPLFLTSTDPVRLRRELRRLGDRHRVTARQAAEIGRVIGADYVVTLALARFEEDETAKEVTLDVTYALVDPYRYRAVEDGTVRADVADQEDLADVLAERVADHLYRELLRRVE